MALGCQTLKSVRHMMARRTDRSQGARQAVAESAGVRNPTIKGGELRRLLDDSTGSKGRSRRKERKRESQLHCNDDRGAIRKGIQAKGVSSTQRYLNYEPIMTATRFPSTESKIHQSMAIVIHLNYECNIYECKIYDCKIYTNTKIRTQNQFLSCGFGSYVG